MNRRGSEVAKKLINCIEKFDKPKYILITLNLENRKIPVVRFRAPELRILGSLGIALRQRDRHQKKYLWKAKEFEFLMMLQVENVWCRSKLEKKPRGADIEKNKENIKETKACYLERCEKF